jgi:hypothetical protein
LALTNDEITKTLANMMTKQEYRAFLRSIEKIDRLVANGGYYAKPPDGIPKKDLSLDVQEKLNEVDQCYKPGKAINEDSLPSNVPTTTYVNNATRGLIRTDLRANRAIDEVYEARESTVGEPMTSVKQNLNTHYSRKDEIIENINGEGETGTIDKEHVEPPAHSEVTGTTANDLHPMNSIQGLTAALSAKVDTVTIIATINLSAEPTKINVAQIDMSGLDHSDLGGTTDAGCHPQSAITDLTTDLSDLDSRLDSVETAISDLTGFESQQHDNNNCLADAIAELFTNAGLSIPDCIQALETP